MSTQATTVEFILQSLGDNPRFHTRAMFGEYALYVDSKVVGLICDDQLYLKILPASSGLEKICEQDAPYPGAKNQYIIQEHQYANLPEIMIAIAASLPEPKKKTKKK